MPLRIGGRRVLQLGGAEAGYPNPETQMYVDFDGIQTYGSFSSSVVGDTPNGSDDGITVALWVYRATGDAQGYLMSHGLGHKEIYLSSGGTIIWVGRGSNTIASAAVGADQWTHILVTAKNSDLSSQIFVNGSSVGTGTITSAIASLTTDVYVGKRANDTIYTNNSIADLGMWNKVLSAGEIASAYNGGKMTDYRKIAGTNLLRYFWMGDEDTYPTITDHGTIAKDMTYTNGSITDWVSGGPSI